MKTIYRAMRILSRRSIRVQDPTGDYDNEAREYDDLIAFEMDPESDPIAQVNEQNEIRNRIAAINENELLAWETFQKKGCEGNGYKSAHEIHKEQLREAEAKIQDPKPSMFIDEHRTGDVIAAEAAAPEESGAKVKEAVVTVGRILLGTKTCSIKYPTLRTTAALADPILDAAIAEMLERGMITETEPGDLRGIPDILRKEVGVPPEKVETPNGHITPGQLTLIQKLRQNQFANKAFIDYMASLTIGEAQLKTISSKVATILISRMEAAAQTK